MSNIKTDLWICGLDGSCDRPKMSTHPSAKCNLRHLGFTQKEDSGGSKGQMRDTAFEDVGRAFVDGRGSVYAFALSFMPLPSKSASGHRVVASPTIEATLLKPRQLSTSARPRVP